LFRLPPHAREAARIEVWSEDLPRGGRRGARRANRELPATLAGGLLGWEGDPRAVVDAWVWCRTNPRGVRRAFRSRAAWEGFLDALRTTLDERIPEAGAPPALDLLEAATLYQSLYWVARTAAVPTPDTDVLLVTAAGWSAIPALVHKALHGTPMVLTEHGVYVRESYLAAVRGGGSPGARFIATRLARGLTRVAYESADMIAPVSDANAYWEMGLGIDPAKILVLYNGLARPPSPAPPPRTRTVVVIGRIDPLKDIHTTLRVAAGTLELVPDARFLHYGPVTDGEEAYGRSCRSLHEQLGLGDRFAFMGRTTDPLGAVRAADVFLMTSISEGLPMSILEAMGQGRPVVSTGVGGVPEVVKGCGIVTAPGDEHALAMAVATLLRNPDLAW
jgi:glycosyltransferase involved in cell wall biosynthesis